MTTQNNEYWHDLLFDSGLKLQCKQLEGQYLTAYYNGPIESPYTCNSENRKLIILHDVLVDGVFMDQQLLGETISIKKKSSSIDPGTTDQWTYTNIKIEKMKAKHDYTFTEFDRIEISYSEEKHLNSIFL